MADELLQDITSEQVRSNLVKDINFHGRRITNASPSRASKDYVIRKELDTEVENLLGVILATADTDTDILDAPTVSLKKQATNATISGNGFEVDFNLPAQNLATYDGYTVVINDTNTLPSTTTFDSGTAGELLAAINRLTDSTKSWTVDSLIGKQVMVFSTKRAGSPTYDGEATLFIAGIISNTATTIELDLPYDQPYQLIGLKYYIVTPAASNYWFEKVKYYTPFQTDRFGYDTRKLRFDGGTATIYCWVLLHNYWGWGRAGSPATITFDGISTGEIKLLSVDNGRIAALAVTFDKINVSTLSAISADIGNVTAGTITGALIRTASSGARVEIDSTNGLRAFNASSVLQCQIPVSGGNAGYITFTDLRSISSVFVIQNSAVSSEHIFSGIIGHDLRHGGASVVVAGSGGVVVASGIALTMTSANINFTSGFGIASGNVAWALHSTNGLVGYDDNSGAQEVVQINSGGTKINIGGTYYTLSVVAGAVMAT